MTSLSLTLVGFKKKLKINHWVFVLTGQGQNIYGEIYLWERENSSLGKGRAKRIHTSYIHLYIHISNTYPL